ncbi:MAG TPA: putative sugar O-methyltransferase [Verrucomicrobiae bacterium]|jgi:hypothetical protein|nr:putative sugar O-methyltransferase [Verrucomicrobiae bacterium]
MVRLFRKRGIAAGNVAGAVGAFTEAGATHRAEFVSRIKGAYRLATKGEDELGDSMWAEIAKRNLVVHEALMADDGRLEGILNEPGKSDLFYGFHSLFADRTGRLRTGSEKERRTMAEGLFREVVRLCQALGRCRVRNPESPAEQNAFTMKDLEMLLDGLDGVFGSRVHFPNPYPDEFGLVTSRGVASYRAIHALYQAFRVRQLAKVYGARILEIGAGMGRTVGYLWGLGLRDCTIVDLPMTNVAQASFLGQTIGAESITLFGEKPGPGRVRIFTPDWLRKCGEKFDVVLNVDSMTEMDRRYAEEYGAFIRTNAKCFLSINHDANPFRVCDLDAFKPAAVGRFPYWMREGYTEEIYV